MKLYLNNPELDGQLQRSASKDNYGMANLGECLVIASRINEDNIDTWYDAFFDFAQALEQSADRALKKGHMVSAQQQFLRATEYYRNAFFYHRNDINNIKLQTAFKAHQTSFKKFISLSDLSIYSLNIPFDKYFFRGYFAHPKVEKQKRPTIIHLGGYDGTIEEMYPAVVESIARGYNIYLMDGPGQGSCLYDEHIFMRPDWENIIKPVVDQLLKQPQVDENAICLLGRSFGGYLGVRAAAYEKRISALILDPGQFDISERIKEKLPPELANHIFDQDSKITKKFSDLLKDTNWERFFLPRMATHGVKTVQEYCQVITQYSNASHAEKITCPTLVCENVTDIVSSKQGELLYNHLTCQKSFISFTAEEGAEGHCEGLGQPIFYTKMFDWLAETMFPNLPD